MAKVYSVAKNCSVCGAAFTVPPCRAATANVCSRGCRSKSNAAKYEKARVKKVCPVCSKNFSVYPASASLRTCCSIACANKMPDRKRSSGSDHYNWKGGVTKHTDGYLYVAVVNHPFFSLQKYVLEHRLVMERWMRSKLKDHSFLVDVGGVLYLRPEISVHHMNEVKRDNRPSNLIACTSSAHRTIHNGGIPVPGSYWPDSTKF